MVRRRVTTAEIRSDSAPRRTCIGCRRVLPQAQLHRCVSGPSGVLLSRTAPGRGAWLCSIECFEVACKRGGFARAWKRPVDAEALDALRIEFEAVITNVKDLSVAGKQSGPMPTKG